MTIGFGDESIPLGKKGAIDSEALRRLAWPTASQFHAAQDVQSLGELFGVARQLLVNRWQLTFSTHRGDRGQLAGLDLRFQIRLRLDDDRILKSSWVAFKTPQMSVPPFEGKLDAAERQALTQISSNLPAPPPLVGRSSGGATGSHLRQFRWTVGVSLVCRATAPLAQPKETATQSDGTTRDPQAAGKSYLPEGNLPASPGGSSQDQSPVRQGPGKTEIQLQAQSSPDRTLFDPRGQQTVVPSPTRGLLRSCPARPR